MFPKERVAALREASGRIEREGGLTADALSFIYDEGLFKLFVPPEYGGSMTPLPEALRLFEASSRIDGSFGWAVTIGAGGGYFASCLAPDVARAVYSSRSAVIAGSGTPTGKAVRMEGGYRLSGAWKYCSGAPYATTFTAAAAVEGAEPGEPAALAFALAPEQVEIAEDWRPIGLKGTASHTIVVTDAFVPSDRAFRVDRSEWRKDPIYRVPFLPFAESSFGAVALGIWGHLLEEAGRIAQDERARWNAGDGERRYLAVMKRVEEGIERFKPRAAQFYESAEQAWTRHLDGGAAADDWAELGRQSKLAAAEALDTAQPIMRTLGLGAMMEDAAINRIWRDLLTACQHKLLIDYGAE